MKAVELRIEIASNRAALAKGWGRKALSGINVFSEAQQYKRRRIILVATRYFSQGKGVEEISAVMGISHQRVSAMLGDAVKLLEYRGLILRNGSALVPAEPRPEGRRK